MLVQLPKEKVIKALEDYEPDGFSIIPPNDLSKWVRMLSNDDVMSAYLTDNEYKLLEDYL